MGRPRTISPQSRAVLAALFERPRTWAYGYELSKRTDLKSGTMYPLLMRLCDQGLLEDGWEESEEPGRPRRHIYRLTPKGLELAREVARSQPGTALQGRSREALA
jgi:PadR family transcriptional regulator PadR